MMKSIQSFVGQLIAAPLSAQTNEQIRIDEMALFVVLIMLCFILATCTTIGLEVYEVVWKHFPWNPEAFANAMATEFGVTTGLMSVLALGMGLKAKLGG